MNSRKPQFQLWQMKQAWWQEKAQEFQDATDRCDFKLFCQNLRDVFEPVSNGSAPIFFSNGNLLMDKKDITKFWEEYFSNVLKMESNVDENLINNLPQRPFLWSYQLFHLQL